MKIIGLTCKRVNAVRCGDVFDYESELYIRTNQSEGTGEELVLVCVCLSNGLALKIDPNTPVNEVDGAFVIGGEKGGDENA